MAFADPSGGSGGGSTGSAVTSHRTVPDIYEPEKPKNSAGEEEVTLNGVATAGAGINPLIKVNSEETSMNDTCTSPTDPTDELVFLPRAVSRDLLQSELAIMSG